jgi:hypothetical protein
VNREQLLNPRNMGELANRLEECPAVTRFDEGDNKEAWTLAHAFMDLEESFRKYLDELLPQVVDPTTKEERLVEVLLDVAEEFRHVLYHLHDPKFFRYMEPTHDWLVLSEGKKEETA